MIRHLKAALCAASFLCATQAGALVFTVSPDQPVSLILPTDGSQDNRSFAFNAIIGAASATSFLLTLSTFDANCAASPICTATFPGGTITSTTSYFVDAAASQSIRTSLPGTRNRGTDVTVLFSTTGNVPVTFTDLVVTSAVGLVPEPATWALMLAGFGMVGYAMRKRRTSVAFA